RLASGGPAMIRQLLILCVLSAGQICTAQSEDSTIPRSIDLQQAVKLSLEHNHNVRISSLKVEEQKHAKEVARSAYLPSLKNRSTFAHATDTQFIAIPPGSLGAIANNPIPSKTLIVNQGALNFALSDTELVQPLTELFKIRAANDIARA